MKLCSIADCGGQVIARGWCRIHYYRWKNTGDPLMVRKATPNPYVRTPEIRARLSQIHKRHGMSRTPTHNSWSAMIQRCTDVGSKDYPKYGGRGITVCARWQVFENFLDDMGLRPEGTSLDRIDNDGNYEPGNCRWATPYEQTHNRGPIDNSSRRGMKFSKAA